MTREDYEQWRSGPVTEEVMRLLRLKADTMEVNAGTSLFMATAASDFEIVRRNAIFVRGQVDSLDFIINAKWEDLSTE